MALLCCNLHVSETSKTQGGVNFAVTPEINTFSGHLSVAHVSTIRVRLCNYWGHHKLRQSLQSSFAALFYSFSASFSFLLIFLSPTPPYALCTSKTFCLPPHPRHIYQHGSRHMVSTPRVSITGSSSTTHSFFICCFSDRRPLYAAR